MPLNSLASGEEITFGLEWFILFELYLESFNDGDIAGGQFAFGVTFANQQMLADSGSTVVKIKL